MEEDHADGLKSTVRRQASPNDLKPGLPVMPVELFATPWARIFNGSLSDGIAYRASRLDFTAPAAHERADRVRWEAADEAWQNTCAGPLAQPVNCGPHMRPSRDEQLVNDPAMAPPKPDFHHVICITSPSR